MVSGAPWHVRTLQLDGSGNKNQDRSIQPSAIVGELPPFALAPPTPTPRPTNPPAAPPPPKQGPPANPPTGGGGGSNPGSPNGPGGVPAVTVPPTTALSDDVAPPPSQGLLPVVLLGLFVTTFATLLGVRRAGRDGRSRGGRGRSS